MSKTAVGTESSIDVPSIKDREHFAISVPADGVAVVENRRHDEPDEHTYAVNVAESGETVECTCPADEYQQKCKHRLAVESTECVVLAATSEAR
jgi:ferredoxin-like protein FixX